MVDTEIDSMKKELNLDVYGQQDSPTPMLPFDAQQVDRCGLRMTRAQFSRFLGVSKQAVTDWVRQGKITIGADGLLDPRQAVGQLMRNSDPSKVRARVLEPLTRDLVRLRSEVDRLSLKLGEALENCEFQEAANVELHEILSGIRNHLDAEWEELRKLPAHMAIASIHGWLDAMDTTVDTSRMITDFLPPPDATAIVAAPDDQERGWEFAEELVEE